MKILSRTFALILLTLLSVSCQDGEARISPASNNSHSNERANAVTVISTTTTLAAGAYDVIEIAAGGRLTFSTGNTTVNAMTYSNGGAAASVTVPSNANVVVSGTQTVPSAVVFTINGTFQGSMVVQTGATINNNIIHKALTLYMEGGRYNLKGQLEAGKAVPLSPPYIGDLVLSSGNLAFQNCGTLIAPHITVNAPGVMTGTGFIQLLSSNSFANSLTNSPGIRVCATGYSVSGLGAAVLSCTPYCQ